MLGLPYDRHITIEIELLKRIDSHAQDCIRKMDGGKECATLNNGCSDSRISACLINPVACPPMWLH